MSKFNYYQLIWMCHNRTKNNKINKLHERCLRLLYNDKISSFHDLLERDGSVVTEIFHLIPQDQYNLKSQSHFTLPIVRTVNYQIESIRYLGPKIWESIPANIKKPNTIERFKSGIKKWKPESCPCRLYKTYLQQIGYMQA